MRDACRVTSHQVLYEGPSSLAVGVATLLADAEGIALTSAEREETADGSAETVRLVLTVEATRDAVMAAVASIAGQLPAGARLTVEDPLDRS